MNIKQSDGINISDEVLFIVRADIPNEGGAIQGLDCDVLEEVALQDTLIVIPCRGRDGGGMVQ